MSKPLGYFRVLSLLLIANGKWDFQNKNTVFRFIFQIFLPKLLQYYFFTMTQMLLVTAIIWRNCTTRVMEMSGIYVQYMNVIITLLILKNSSKFQKIQNVMLKYDRNNHLNTELKRIYLKHAKLNSSMVLLIFFLITSVSAYWWPYSVW